MDDQNPEAPTSGALVLTAGVFYLLMTLVGLGLILVQDLEFETAVLGEGSDVGRDALLGAGSGLLVVGITWLCRGLESVQTLNKELRALLGNPSSLAIAGLAVSSAVGEEIFFRGALQPLLGFWITAVLFGLLHGGSSRRFRVWTAFAMVAGLLLGGLATYTENLLAPILCHMTINYFNLHLVVGTEPS
jgi:membrane protease YdiL (CAAX protease family)